MSGIIDPSGHLSAADARPADIYEARRRKHSERLQVARARDSRLVTVRAILFLFALLCGIAAFFGDSSVGWFAVPPLLLLFAAALVHARVRRRLTRLKAIDDYYRDCLLRISDRWSELPDTGADLLPSDHPFASDLDLFGKGSLFQRINQCLTGAGRRMLAGRLTEFAQATDYEVRLTQADSLRNEHQLREELAVLRRPTGNRAAAHRIGDNSAELDQWLADTGEPVSRVVLALSLLIGAAAVIIVPAAALQLVPGSLVLLPLVLQAPLIMATRRQIRSVAEQLDGAHSELELFGRLAAVFEGHSFSHPSVAIVQDELDPRGMTASNRIRRLGRTVRWFNHAVRNQFFAPIAWATGILLLLTHRIDRWRRRHGKKISGWRQATSQLEVLVSVGAWNFDHPEYAQAQLVTDIPRLEAVGLGHPLLPETEVVCNNVELGADRPLMLISGSNMSGKSTLLRAIGVNQVLAGIGARVFAERMTTYPYRVGTAMRVQDSLQDGRSLFFSVIQRLKMVVDQSTGEGVTLFLLDEILHGTNSHDRRIGAEAVIRSLVNSGAVGLVTTHDLALTAIADSMDGKAVNMHFEDHVEDGVMKFDYQLRPGIVERSNALELMRMVGLDV